METKQSNVGIWVALIAVAIMAAGALFLGFATANKVTATQTQVGGITNYDSIQLTKVGTSTLSQVGCYQGYATSTQTPIILTYGIVGTSTITGGPTSSGSVQWKYGLCGNSPGL